MESHSVQILTQIFLMFAAAKVLGVVGERVKVPTVISEIVAGILIGPHLLRLVQVEEWTLALAELGAIVLLFDVGLDQKLTDLMKVGGTALLVATLGVIVPFFLGYGLLILREHSQAESIFMGAAMVATREGVNYVQIASVAALAVGFTLFIVLAGRRVMRRVTPRVQRFAAGDPYFALAMVICLGLGVAADKIGIAAIVGAFLAGLVFSEEELTPRLKTNIHALREFLVPFFFVAMGMQMDLAVLARKEILLLAGLVTLLAILGKLVGCGLGAYRLGWRSAIQVGVGMVPRGEVGIIVASIGLGLHTISNEI